MFLLYLCIYVFNKMLCEEDLPICISKDMIFRKKLLYFQFFANNLDSKRDLCIVTSVTPQNNEHSHTFTMNDSLTVF